MPSKYLIPSAYSDILALQNGVCAICGRVPHKGRRLSLDHDHSTGKYRGLLCISCNTLLGLYERLAGNLFYYLLDDIRIDKVNEMCNQERSNSFYTRKTRCIHGHPLEGDNLRIDTHGHRVCLTCQAAAMKRYRSKHKLGDELGTSG